MRAPKYTKMKEQTISRAFLLPFCSPARRRPLRRPDYAGECSGAVRVASETFLFRFCVAFGFCSVCTGLATRPAPVPRGS